MNKGFVEYVLDSLSFCPGITVRSMFGGHGVYKDGIIFGIIIECELYFKVSPETVAEYKESGSSPFTYQSKEKQVSMSYWQVPEHVMEDQDLLYQWMQKAVKASAQAKRSKK